MSARLFGNKVVKKLYDIYLMRIISLASGLNLDVKVLS